MYVKSEEPEEMKSLKRNRRHQPNRVTPRNRSRRYASFLLYIKSLFSRVATYINRFMVIIPRHPAHILLYSNLPDFMCGMIAINQLIYVSYGQILRLHMSDPKP